jgi:putative SOS response-associated peptidase YedK
MICNNLLVMCGRYRLSRRKQIIEEHFDSVSGEEDWTPRYNIAPTQLVPVVCWDPKKPVRELSLSAERYASIMGNSAEYRSQDG